MDMEKNKGGRPIKEFDKKQFEDLIGIGCSQSEICWYFRSNDGTPIDDKTITKWCKKTYGMSFSEYSKKYGAQMLRISLRRHQIKLAEHSAAMAIFLGKQYLDQRDTPNGIDDESLQKIKDALGSIDSAIN